MAAIKTRDYFTSQGFKHNVNKTESGSEVHSYTSDLGPDTPVLTLIHGYPQSAYIYRYLAPLLLPKISLFIPELPGYGISTPQPHNDKRSIGNTLISALTQIFGPHRPTILGGHDRGARICHRLAVDASQSSPTPSLGQHPILGVTMLDIVPTTAQWRAGALNPAIIAGYFHWPLLANVAIATEMIMALGGGKWVRDKCMILAGPSKEGIARVHDMGGVDVYADLFESESTVRYSCEDYKAGAFEDVEEQGKDQEAGRKIGVPTLVMFSKARLGRTQDVERVWREWIHEGVEYRGVGVGEERGHYLPEEAFEVVEEEVGKFIDKVVAKGT